MHPGKIMRIAAYPSQALWVLTLTLLVLFGHALPELKFFSVPSNYLPLHTALEFVAMAVSVMVFSLAWNLRSQPDNSHLMLLGAGFLAVCLIDFAHTLSYAGMPVWVTPSGPEKAINFWLAGRLVAAGVLLAVAWRPVTRWSSTACFGAVAVALALALGSWWLGLFFVDSLPRTFVAGHGLTAFKVGSEYLLCGLYAVAALVLHRQGRRLNKDSLQWLAVAAWVQGLAELFFTLYADVTDLFNLLGHVYKAISYIMVYHAIFFAGVQTPNRKLRESNETLRGILETTLDGFLLVDEHGHLLDANPTYSQLSGYSHQELQALWISDLEAVESATEIAQHIERIRNSGCDLFETRHRRKDGSLWQVEVSVTYRPVAGGQFFVFLRDITQRKQMEEKVRQLAFYDTLTKLPNRRLLIDRLHQTMAASKRSGSYAALMYLDLDNFKPLNDVHGHGAGDLLLIEVAKRLTACVREMDTVARFGGDEFVVLLGELDADKVASISQARHVAEKVRTSLSAPYLLKLTQQGKLEVQVEHHCSASIGVLVFLNHDGSGDDILKCADTAMYQAKDAGRNTIRFYEAHALNDDHPPS